ncbi:membrane metallo-endopeptidase-like 1 [Haematobia irritans]|uniref:membrane metallo-endopeptidase-like 1 n=1 Tax=Haematobia irritans TaxID=7368 RepID=UPI003F4F8A86
MWKIFGILFMIWSRLIGGQLINSPTIKQLHIIKESMNTSYDPCEDFYQYACANWQRKYATEDYNEMMGLLDYQMNAQLKEILENEDFMEVIGDNTMALEKMKLFYKSCLMKSNDQLLEYFDYIKPGDGKEWPLLQILAEEDAIEWNNSEFDVFVLLGELMSYDFNNCLVNISLHRNLNGSLQIQFDLPDINSMDGTQTIEGIAKAMIFMEFPEDKAYLYAQEFMENDIYWKKTYKKYSSKDNEEILSYDQLKLEYPQLWSLLETMLPAKIQTEDEVHIVNLEYYQFLLEYLTQSNLKITKLLNYLQLRFLDFLYEDALEDCVKDVHEKMYLAVNYLYFTKIFSTKSRLYNAEVNTITEKIYQYFNDILEENQMNLSPSQLVKIKEKILHLKVNIGNLPENVNDEKIDEFYSNIEAMVENNYFQNHLKLLKHRLSNRLLSFQNFTHSLAQFSSTGYDEDINMVIIPFSYLQSPLYNIEYDDIFKWSLLGYLVSHEFSHALDTNGLQYDPHGSESPLYQDILDNPKFSQTMECLHEQLETANINERFADTITVRLAFRGYVNENRQHLQPRFTYLPWNQLFFLNIAQFYCGSDDVDSSTLHQIVKNSEDFAQAFQCPVASPLNPVKRCRLF